VLLVLKANWLLDHHQLKMGLNPQDFWNVFKVIFCGPIHPPCGPCIYFMVLVDASTRWSYVCLLSTRNLSFVRLLAQIIRLRAQFSDYIINNIYTH
jgi:hypothetical protein